MKKLTTNYAAEKAIAAKRRVSHLTTNWAIDDSVIENINNNTVEIVRGLYNKVIFTNFDNTHVVVDRKKRHCKHKTERLEKQARYLVGCYEMTPLGQDIFMGKFEMSYERQFRFHNWEIKEETDDAIIYHLPNDELVKYHTSSETVMHDGKLVADGIPTAKHLIANGNDKYQSFPGSNADSRSNSFWMLSKDIDMDEFLDEATDGLWSKIKNNQWKIAKIRKYLGLICSSSDEISIGRKLKVALIKGPILPWDPEFRATDGLILICESAAREIVAKKYGKSSKMLKEIKAGFVFQVRIGAQVKGLVLVISDELWNTRFAGLDMVLTDTTLKVGDENNLPAALETGTINIVNLFNREKEDKKLTFMFTQMLINPNLTISKVQEILRKHVTWIREDIEAALKDQTKFLEKFGVESSETVDLQSNLRASVAICPRALKDKLFIKSAINQSKYEFDDLKAGKLPGVKMRVMVPNPLLFFLGTYNRKTGEIIHSKSSLEKCLLKEGEVYDDIAAEEILITRSPSNIPGQMVKAVNARYRLENKKIKIGGKTFTMSDIFRTGEWCNTIYFNAVDNIAARLAGADYDGDTVKIAVLKPGKELMEKHNGDNTSLAKEIGPWRELFCEHTPFIAIGDTVNSEKPKVLTWEALRESKNISMVIDQTGEITNNLFFLIELMMSCYYIYLSIVKNDISLVQAKAMLGNILKPNVCWILQQMAYHANGCMCGNPKSKIYQIPTIVEIKKKFDKGIVAEMEGIDLFYDFLKKSGLYDLMAAKKSSLVLDKLFSSKYEGKLLAKVFLNRTMAYLMKCARVFGHLQMIQIDAASTGFYPDLKLFSFARLRHEGKVIKKNEDGTTTEKTVGIEAAPAWFYDVKDKKLNHGVYPKSYSVQGILYEIAKEEWEKVKAFKIENETPLFDKTDNVEADKWVNIFAQNLYQAETLKAVLLSKLRTDSKDRNEEMAKFYNQEVKANMSEKVKFLETKAPISDLVKKAYWLSRSAMDGHDFDAKAETSIKGVEKSITTGSATKANMFMRYFGTLAAAYLKHGQDSLVFKVKEPIMVEGLVVSNNGKLTHDGAEVGTILEKGMFEGYMSNGYYICKPTIEESIPTRILMVQREGWGHKDALDAKIEIRDGKSTLAFYKDHLKVAEAMAFHAAQLLNLKNRKVTVSIDAEDKKRAKANRATFKAYVKPIKG